MRGQLFFQIIHSLNSKDYFHRRCWKRAHAASDARPVCASLAPVVAEPSRGISLLLPAVTFLPRALSHMWRWMLPLCWTFTGGFRGTAPKCSCQPSAHHKCSGGFVRYVVRGNSWKLDLFAPVHRLSKERNLSQVEVTPSGVDQFCLGWVCAYTNSAVPICYDGESPLYEISQSCSKLPLSHKYFVVSKADGYDSKVNYNLTSMNSLL